MKSFKLFITLLFIHLLACTHAQVLVNNGANIVISQGSQILVVGDFYNLDDATINNSGIVSLTGDWTNNTNHKGLNKNSSGIVRFFGSIPQLIGGSMTSNFGEIQVQNHVHLQTEISIASELVLSTFSLNIHNANILIEPTAQIIGHSPEAYIIAENSGQILRAVKNTDIDFPVGTSSAYLNLSISNSGTEDTLGVNILEDVLEYGTSGSTIGEISHCVNNTWKITEQTPGDSDLSIRTLWTEETENELFDRMHCGMGVYANGIWNSQSATIAEGNNPYFISRTGITDLSAIAVGDIDSPMAITLDLKLDITAFLEGSFNNEGMETGLNPNNIPLFQPYNLAPWNYSGTEKVDSIPNPAVVDWVLLEFRDASEANLAGSETVITRLAAFLLNDGSIVALDGFSKLNFPDIKIQFNLFIVVLHRNHLAIMSANPLTLNQGIYTYNFSLANTMAYGDEAQNLLKANIFGMISADANSDGVINSEDKTLWESHAGTQGYLNSDMNLDAQVNNQDKNNLWDHNRNKTTKVPK